MASRRASDLATKQGGRVTRAQLLWCGLSGAQVGRWLRGGRLHRVGCGVYALGHWASFETSALHEALLKAGPGAALSHMTAAWWRGLLRYAPRRIHVSAPGRRRSTASVVIHHPVGIQREWHSGMPVAPVGQTMLDIAPLVSLAALRRALAQADHEGLISHAGLIALSRSGRRGSRPVRKALAIHMPELALTASPLEDRFLFLCEHYGIPLPQPNFEIAGYEVDAVWPELGLAVELDGRDVHGTPAAVVRDRRRELAIRSAGFELIRYGSEQVDDHAAATARDLQAAMARAGSRRTG